jgi:hypothetical protein
MRRTPWALFDAASAWIIRWFVHSLIYILSAGAGGLVYLYGLKETPQQDPVNRLLGAALGALVAYLFLAACMWWASKTNTSGKKDDP